MWKRAIRVMLEIDPAQRAKAELVLQMLQENSIS